MQSFFSRLLKSPLASKRLISQLTQRGDGRLSSMLNRLGVQRLLGLFRIKDTQNQRGISSTPVLNADKMLTDDMELATGIFKRELLIRQTGNDDPWMFAKPIKRGAGRENEPTEIPSAFDGRIIGCLCLGDRAPKWMWLEKGDPKRCECGHFYKLVKMEAV